MEDRAYYSISVEETAREFCVGEEEVRQLIRRGGLDAQVREGQYWIHLGPWKREDRLAQLWHGTSGDCIEPIIHHGLQTVSRGGREAWLTSSERWARKHAIGRSRVRNQVPYVVACEVDLLSHWLFWKPSPQVYAFRQPLGPEVIKSWEEVDEREWSRRFRLQLRKAARKETVDVEVTRNSGRLGVLFWINSYLEKLGLPEVTEHNASAGAIIEWVMREYEKGREEPIAAEELEEHMLPLLGGSQ